MGVREFLFSIVGACVVLALLVYAVIRVRPTHPAQKVERNFPEEG